MSIRQYILEAPIRWTDLPESAHLEGVATGTKRAALIEKSLLKKSKFPVERRDVPNSDRTIVYLPQNSKTADAIYKVVRYNNPEKYHDPNYHRILGGLLDYTDEEIEWFIKNKMPLIGNN